MTYQRYSQSLRIRLIVTKDIFCWKESLQNNVKKIKSMKPNTLQLRVIRAFKSTLEDMEEKRSCHSMHSVRSSRSYLSRPASDISYIEDEEKWKSGKLMNASAASNGHFVRGNTHGNVMYAKSPVVEPQAASNYLKVEGGAYRVQRSVSSGSGNLSAQSQTEGGNIHKARPSIDASTQSCESSFTQTDQSCLAPLPPLAHHPLPPPSPHPPVFIDSSDPGRACSALGFTRGTSPTPPYAFGQHQQVGPPACYHSPGPASFPYDPSTQYYHTYLNPLVTAGLDQTYQYDIVVRRPSVGPPELTVPTAHPADPNLRRPSVGPFLGHPSHPSHPSHPHLIPHSLPGSFDSALPPPLGPGYSPQTLSPRHLHQPSNTSSTSPIAVQNKPSNPCPAPSCPPTDIPKLIHETSI